MKSIVEQERIETSEKVLVWPEKQINYKDDDDGSMIMINAALDIVIQTSVPCKVLFNPYYLYSQFIHQLFKDCCRKQSFMVQFKYKYFEK